MTIDASTTEGRIIDSLVAPAPVSPAPIAASPDGPAALSELFGSSVFGRAEVALTELFTSREQRARTSQAYVRSAVGQRLRITDVVTDAAGGDVTVVTQRDETTGLLVTTTMTRVPGRAAARIETSVTNTSAEPVVLTAVVTAALGFGRDQDDLDGFALGVARSEWLAENRWERVPVRRLLPGTDLALHGQDGRGRAGFTSHGAWSSGEWVPVGYLVDDVTGEALAWQVETSAGWHVDLSQTRQGGVLSLLGPSDLEHGFGHELAPGETFEAVPVALAVGARGVDDAVAELTALRRSTRFADHDEPLPIVYNDFMNTLMGQPSTEALEPLIDAAAEAGAEVFCIDAGWFADPAIGDWWATVGEWREADARFSGGLRALTHRIRSHGMRVGIWLEPEVVGAESAAAHELPEEAFFHRFGQRVREHDRFHLDFRHPAARAHLDATIDALVADHDVSYLKLDYNINAGAGTEDDATTAAAGLLAHTRALREWLVQVQRRHPGLQIENCSSGAMRADYALLSVTHLQSTSDQQDFVLYPPIAASAPMAIAPEQCGNWAYPAADMDLEETAFTVVTGLSGRLYLSGFLHELRQDQRALVHEAVRVHRGLREGLREVEPFWPLGLPAWDDPIVCLGLRSRDHDDLFIWDRGDAAASVVVPEVTGEPHPLFPAWNGWNAAATPDGLAIRTIAGRTARVIRIERAQNR
ncbi:glycoside hydrolase family 36 protein [Microbacterium arborescens]|uniref:glycoside hydrolase family 36 protein n=1 Tax=Microbacterium arborescens TaxID=33883 RepID=UPI003C7595E1